MLTKQINLNGFVKRIDSSHKLPCYTLSTLRQCVLLQHKLENFLATNSLHCTNSLTDARQRWFQDCQNFENGGLWQKMDGL